jgi:cytochrome c peroxidase
MDWTRKHTQLSLLTIPIVISSSLILSVASNAAVVGIGAEAPEVEVAGAVEVLDPFSHLGTLNDKSVPLPNLDGIVADKAAAIQLGKALFWDAAIGSDGQSCASCHFQAGADPRITNALSPGLLDQRDINGDGKAGDFSFGGLVSSDVESDSRSPSSTSGLTAGQQSAKPDITLNSNDFPSHKLSDSEERKSSILYTTNDVISSMGTYSGRFISSMPLQERIALLTGQNVTTAFDKCAKPSGGIFHKNGLPVRKVEPRHTPTTVNAVFNFSNFWDGRANNIYNGVDVFGRRDIKNNPRARVLVTENGETKLQALELKNSSLASQAMGPPLSTFEMSCGNRTFADIGRKVLSRKPLANQKVSSQDGVLGSLADSPKGLKGDYLLLIQKAFTDKYVEKTASAAFPILDDDGNFSQIQDTRSQQKYRITDQGQLVKDNTGYTKQELNFSLYWGIAIMLYEATLINDDQSSPFGRFMAGNSSALNASEKKGLDIFMSKGKCANCHKGPTLSAAALPSHKEFLSNGLVERMLMADSSSNTRPALYDDGFYNIGVTPTVQDISRGGKDPYGSPLSWSRQFVDSLKGIAFVDPIGVDVCSFEVRIDSSGICDHDLQVSSLNPDEQRVAVDGAFKTPNLLNVGLTAPYFHNGSAATLEQVVEFYNRGGNRRGEDGQDTSGTGTFGQQNAVNPSPKGSNLDPDITKLGLSTTEKSDLVAFLKTLTDERLRCDQAPFDHPELAVPVGHTGGDANSDSKADTIFSTLSAVGASGYPKSQCIPNTGNVFDLQIRVK